MKKQSQEKDMFSCSWKSLVGRYHLSIQGKIAFFAVLIITIHLLGSVYLAPKLSPTVLESDNMDVMIPYDRKRDGKEDQTNVGMVSKLLTETFSTLHHFNPIFETSIPHNAILMEEKLDKFLRTRTEFSNPLKLPPKTLEEASNTENLVLHTAPPLTQMYHEKCLNIDDPSYQDKGKQWSVSSRLWVKRYGNDVSRYRWCRGGTVAEVPDLERLMLLRSDKHLPNRAITIVTQLSIERLSMLEQQCAHWPHPISAVVYIPLVHGRISSTEDDAWNGASLIRGIEEVKQSYKVMKQSRCVLDIEVVVEERCNFELATLYPTNAVRNRALLLSRSDIVLLLDVDFVVDQSLAFALEDKERHQELMDLISSRVAVILPAFEAWDQGALGKEIALTAVKEGKSFISRKFMYNIVMGFHMAHYPQGHEPTLFWKWINTTEPYQVEHEVGYEPYILMAKRYVPYYDERFRGYYFNKVEHLLHVSTQLKFPFIVHPTSFVVHVPHTKAKTKWRTKRSGQKERNHAMFLDALEDMKLQRFVPVTSFPHLCLPSEMQKRLARTIELGKQNRGAETQIAMLRDMSQLVIIAEEERELRARELSQRKTKPK